MSKTKKRQAAFWLAFRRCSWVLWNLKNWCPRHPSDQEACEKLLNISHQGNTSRKQSEKHFTHAKMGSRERQTLTHVGEAKRGLTSSPLLVRTHLVELPFLPFVLHMYVSAVAMCMCTFTCVSMWGDWRVMLGPLSLFHHILWGRASPATLGPPLLASVTS